MNYTRLILSISIFSVSSTYGMEKLISQENESLVKSESCLSTWSYFQQELQENSELKKTIFNLDAWAVAYEQQKNALILKALSTEKYFPYQDIYINGETLWKGLGTDCVSRYTAIKKALTEKYKRPFTVLDIGANNGYFSFRLARECGSTCVMADMTNRLTDLCQLNTDVGNNIIYIKKQLTADDIKQLSKHVHFDVAIGLHVLHHIPEWKKFFKNLKSLADTLIIETPPANDPRLEKKTSIPAIEQKLLTKNAKVITETPRTVPGYFEDLEEMTPNTILSVPVVENVKSKMFVIEKETAAKAEEFSTTVFKQFNIQYPEHTKANL